jgi:RHS repeat-associated protein
MLLPNRHEDAGEYRYGFQGQEKDDEIKGEGNSVNYKYRMHDPRIGRFFAVDPLTSKYPHYTPYSFSGNKVIHAIELEGLEEIPVEWIIIPGAMQPIFTDKDVVLKSSEWHRSARDCACGSFEKAAEYNTKYNNGQFYDNVAKAHAYYTWAEKKLKGIGINSGWVNAAKTTTSMYEVGLAVETAGLPLSISLETKSFLNTLGKEIMSRFSMPSMNDILEDGNYKGLTGKDMDEAMLIDEQKMITAYFQELQKSDPKAYKTAINNYNEVINKMRKTIFSEDHYLNKTAEHFGTDFDFSNEEHRIYIGKLKLQDYNQEQSE